LLEDGQVGAVGQGHRGAGVLGPGLVGLGRGGVVQQAVAAALAVQVGLGHGVAGRVGPGLAHVQGAVAVAVAADEADPVGDTALLLVGHQQVGQGDVAGVGHRDGVLDDVALLVGGGAAVGAVGVGDAGHLLEDGQVGVGDEEGLDGAHAADVDAVTAVDRDV